MSKLDKIIMLNVSLLAAANILQAGVFLDDFNRSADHAGHASVLGNNWVDGTGSYTTEGQWSIASGEEAQAKNIDDKWNPAEHYILNSNAVTTIGDFSMDFDLRVRDLPEGSARGGMFELGDRDGNLSGDDGYMLALHEDSFWFERIENGEENVTDKIVYNDELKLQVDTDYHFSLRSDPKDPVHYWLFDLVEIKTGKKLAQQKIERKDLESWKNTKNLLGGIMQGPEHAGTTTYFDDFSVESPEAIPVPAVLGLGISIALGLFWIRRIFRLS